MEKVKDQKKGLVFLSLADKLHQTNKRNQIVPMMQQLALIHFHINKSWKWLHGVGMTEITQA